MSTVPQIGPDGGGRRGWGPWPWVVGLALVAAVVVVAIMAAQRVAREAVKAPQKTVNTVADRLEGMAGKVWDRIHAGLKPMTTVRGSVSGQFARLDATPKLVVLTETLDIEVVRGSEKALLWGYLNLGTTEVRIKAPGNKVQFYVPLAGLAAEDFCYDAARRKLVVCVPAPVLDADIVEVQSDPGRIDVETKVGWARLSAFSGKALERRAREALRQEVLKAADTPAVRDLARAKAEAALQAFFGDLTSALADGVTLEFEFADPKAVPPAAK